MPKVRVPNFSISLDGFGTGEGLSLEAPFGHADRRLHEWMFATRFGRTMFGQEGGSEGIDQLFAAQNEIGIGAEIMGAGKFGPPGWQEDPDFTGWWGPNPPFHSPVYVLTNHPRAAIEMEGGTTFHFLTSPPNEALELAKAAAGDLDVRIGGVPTTVRAFLEADLIDYMHVVQVPILLGRGVSPWSGIEGLEERFAIESVSSPSGVTHLTFSRR